MAHEEIPGQSALLGQDMRCQVLLCNVRPSMPRALPCNSRAIARWEMVSLVCRGVALRVRDKQGKRELSQVVNQLDPS